MALLQQRRKQQQEQQQQHLQNPRMIAVPESSSNPSLNLEDQDYLNNKKVSCSSFAATDRALLLLIKEWKGQSQRQHRLDNDQDDDNNDNARTDSSSSRQPRPPETEIQRLQRHQFSSSSSLSHHVTCCNFIPFVIFLVLFLTLWITAHEKQHHRLHRTATAAGLHSKYAAATAGSSWLAHDTATTTAGASIKKQKNQEPLQKEDKDELDDLDFDWIDGHVL